MSTSGIISTSGQWILTPSGGYVKFNYSAITRSAPQFSKTVSIAGGSNIWTLLNVDDVTTEGIYLITVYGDFSSTPWNLRQSFFAPMGYTRLVNSSVQYTPLSGIYSIHADNGGSFLPKYYYSNVSSNYQRSGLIMFTNSNLNSGSITIKLYRVA